MPLPRHFVPAVDGFECAINEGLGWGMVPEIALQTRLNPDQCEVIFPALWLTCPLVWQHWTKASQSHQCTDQELFKRPRQPIYAGLYLRLDSAVRGGRRWGT